MDGLERAMGDAALVAQVQEIAAHVALGELVR